MITLSLKDDLAAADNLRMFMWTTVADLLRDDAAYASIRKEYALDDRTRNDLWWVEEVRILRHDYGPSVCVDIFIHGTTEFIILSPDMSARMTRQLESRWAAMRATSRRDASADKE